MTNEGFYIYEIERLADEYRAEHPSHDTLLPNGAELGKLVDETVAAMRSMAGDKVPYPVGRPQIVKCREAAKTAKELATNEMRFHGGYSDKAVAAMRRNHQ